jgi:hypothetical protein
VQLASLANHTHWERGPRQSVDCQSLLRRIVGPATGRYAQGSLTSWPWNRSLWRNTTCDDSLLSATSRNLGASTSGDIPSSSGLCSQNFKNSPLVAEVLCQLSLLCYFEVLPFPVLTNLIGRTMSVATSKLVTGPLPSRLKCIRNWPSLSSPMKPSGKAGSTS